MKVKVLECHIKTDEVNFIYPTEGHHCSSTVDLQLLPKENNNHHYALITDFNRFLGRRSANSFGRFVCHCCLHMCAS